MWSAVTTCGYFCSEYPDNSRSRALAFVYCYETILLSNATWLVRITLCLTFTTSPQVLARLYAVGLYLFMDHWVMTFLHRDIANVLEREARMEEAAYHYHQGVHMLLAAFDRYALAYPHFFSSCPCRLIEDAHCLLSIWPGECTLPSPSIQTF